jgi:hypothetical protein
MHHLKETTIDGVKFVLIPEELHDELAKFVYNCNYGHDISQLWKQFDPEIFNGL